MTFEIKKRILFVALLLAMAWPALHHLAVERYDVDPWMFFGLSMYTRPRPIVTVADFRVARGQGRLRAVNRKMLGKQAARKAKRIGDLTGELALSRLAFGTLGSPEDTARELFRLVPRADRLHIQLKIGEMDARATMSIRLIDYECTRRGPDADVQCSIREGSG